MAIVDLRTTVTLVSPPAGDVTQCGPATYRVRVQNASATSVQDADGATLYGFISSTPAGALNILNYNVDIVSPGVVTATPIGVTVPGSFNGARVTSFPAGGSVEYLVNGTVSCNAQVAMTTATAWAVPAPGDSLPSPNQSVGSVLFTVNPLRIFVTGTKTLCGGGTVARIGHRERWKIVINNAGPTNAPAGGEFTDLLPDGVRLLRWRYTSSIGQVQSGTQFPVYAPAIPAGTSLTMMIEGDVGQCVCPGPIRNCFTYKLAPGAGQVGNSTSNCLNLCWDGSAARVEPASCVTVTDCTQELCCNTPGSVTGTLTIRLFTPDGKPAIDPRNGKSYSCGVTYGPYAYDSTGCVETCPLPRNSELLTSAIVNVNGSTISSACTGQLSYYEATITTNTFDEFGRQVGTCTETPMRFTLLDDDPRIVGDRIPVRSIADGSPWAEYLSKCAPDDFGVCD